MLTHCTYGAHSQRITPAAICGVGRDIRTLRLRSHTVSTPQTNATLSQAVPAIRGCRLRVYIDNI